MIPAQPNQSLIDGLACLQALAAADQPVGVRELARQLNLETTRVSRLLGTLAHLGLAEKNANRKYRTGPGMHVLSAQSLRGSRLLQKAWPALRALRKEKLTVALGVLWQDQVCYLYHGRPDHAFEEGVFHFDLFPAHKSTIGQVLLAARPELASPELAPLLQEIREQGYAYLDRGQGERTVGVPVGHPAVAGLAFAGQFPASRIPRLVKLLQSTVKTIEENL